LDKKRKRKKREKELDKQGNQGARNRDKAGAGKSEGQRQGRQKEGSSCCREPGTATGKGWDRGGTGTGNKERRAMTETSEGLGKKERRFQLL
jgi:hypothetical protein